MRLRKPGSRASKPSPTSARERAAKRAEKKRSAAKPTGLRAALQRPAGKPAGRREAAQDRFGATASVAKRSSAELIGIARELVRIPLALYMRIAEWLGVWVLALWLRIWPYLVRAWRLAGRALAWAQRVATPARVTVGVALLTAVALAGSQWADLSAISVGTDAYKGLEDIAPAPEVTTKTVGESHAWIGIPLAIAAALLIIGSSRGRPDARASFGSCRHRRRHDQPSRRPAGGARRRKGRGFVRERDGRAPAGFLGTTRVRRRPHPPRSRAGASPRA